MACISVVIPTWKRPDLLRSVLSDLASQTLRPGQVIVVDNGGDEETKSITASAGGELISFPENRGFAVAVNAGIRAATGDWILILNNDVTLPPDWLQTLRAGAETAAASFAVGKLLSYDDPVLLDGSWDLLSRGAHAWRCGFGRLDGPHWAESRSIYFAPMTAALFHKAVFENIGLLDEGFEAYYEDVDFGLRCALAGLQGVYVPNAVGKHMGKNTLGRHSQRVAFLTARNQVYLLAKHFPAATLRRWIWPVLMAQLLSAVGAAQSGQFLAALRGIKQGLNRWKALRGNEADPAAIEKILSESEAGIKRIQYALGCDPYWRLYFSLVR